MRASSKRPGPSTPSCVSICNALLLLRLRAKNVRGESRVTPALGRVKRDGSPEQERLKRRLEQVYDRNYGEVEA